jgi:hypothetical protein
MKDDVLKETQRKMDKVLEAMARDLTRVRTGRASVALLEGIKVDCYGTSMPIAQVSSLAGAAHGATLGPHRPQDIEGHPNPTCAAHERRQDYQAAVASPRTPQSW